MVLVSVCEVVRVTVVMGSPPGAPGMPGAPVGTPSGGSATASSGRRRAVTMVVSCILIVVVFLCGVGIVGVVNCLSKSLPKKSLAFLATGVWCAWFRFARPGGDMRVIGDGEVEWICLQQDD